jgi:hypothetical protein
MFDVSDYWNCKVHEMKGNKRKMMNFYDKFRQYFINLLTHMTYCPNLDSFRYRTFI